MSSYMKVRDRSEENENLNKSPSHFISSRPLFTFPNYPLKYPPYSLLHALKYPHTFSPFDAQSHRHRTLNSTQSGECCMKKSTVNNKM